LIPALGVVLGCVGTGAGTRTGTVRKEYGYASLIDAVNISGEVVKI